MRELFFASLYLVTSSALVSSYTTRTLFKKLECNTDVSVSIDPVCKLKVISRYTRNLTFGFTILKPTAKLLITAKQLRKTYTNHYMPGLFNIKTEYCEIANRTSVSAGFVINVMKNFGPHLYKMYEDNVLYCPLSGVIEVKQQIISKVVNQLIMPPGEYKVEARFYDERNVTYYGLKTYYNVFDQSNMAPEPAQ